MNDQSEISHSKQFLGGIEMKISENTINISSPVQNLLGINELGNLPSGQQFFPKRRASRRINAAEQRFNTPRNNVSISNLNVSGFNNSRDNDTIQNRSQKSRNKAENKQSKPLLLQTFKVKTFTQKLLNLSNKNRFDKLNKNHFALIDDRASHFVLQQVIPKQKKPKSLELKHESYIYSQQDGIKKSFSNVNMKNCIINSQLFTRMLEQLNKIPVVSPTGTFKFIWDLIMMVVTVSYLFMIPIELTFYKPLDQLFPYYILLFCNIALLLDFILQWNLGYFEKGLPNMNRIKVMAKYFKSQIYLDITSSFFLVIGFFTSNNQVNVLHLLFFIRFKSAKLFFKKLEERFNLNPIIMQLSNLIQLLLLIVTVSHLIGCVWISVSHYETEIGKDSWISDKKVDSDDWLSQYIYAYYYSTVTMITVGYGDFKPVNLYYFLIYKYGILISVDSLLQQIKVQQNRQINEYISQLKKIFDQMIKNINQFFKENNLQT